MGTTTAWGLRYPANTDKVADGYLNIQRLAEDVDADLTTVNNATAAAQATADAAVPKALVDAKGDLLVGTAADALARVGVGADGQVLTADAAQPAGLRWAAQAVAGGARRVHVVPHQKATAHVEWNGLSTASTGALFGLVSQSLGNLNNYREWNVYLDAGTYTLTLWHHRDVNRGVYTVSLGGTNVGTIDGYAASTVVNVETAITGIAVGTAGYLALRLTMASKNASSGAHYGVISLITLERTA